MRWILGLCVGLLLATAAEAGTPFKVKMKCPVGGKSFTHIETMSYTTWGARPDGRPYGSWIFPQPLPVCPANGLVVYREYSRDEIARLGPLIAEPAYRELVARDTDYYRAAWLARTLEPANDDTTIWLLLRASWQVDEKPELKARYQAEFAEAAGRASTKPSDFAWFILQGRRANSLRELGRFDEATAVLKAIPRSELDVPTPPALPEGQEMSEQQRQERQEAEQRQAWNLYLRDLEMLITRQDRSAEPLDAIPTNIAAQYCVEAEKAGRAAQPACGLKAVSEAIAEIKSYERN